MENPVIIHTDGSCLGNPGPGGWGAVLTRGGKEREISGGEKQTTNNRMEMTAVIRALAALKRRCAAHVYTDSQYLSRGMNEWLPQWRRRDFRRADGKAVKNADLWRQLDALTQQHDIRWFWVRGHDGNALNERADGLARKAAAEFL